MRIRGPLLFCSTSLALVLLFTPAVADAQRRGGGHGVRGGGGGRVVVVNRSYRSYRPYYYSPFYYDPFYWSYYSWYYPSFYGPLPPAYWGYRMDNSSAVRLQVTPRQAEVYVDGYLAGTVDDFDGTFQRLNLPPGEHEIVLYLAGYRTVSQKVYLESRGTFRIRYTMEPLPAGAPPEPRPLPPPDPPPSAQAPANAPEPMNPRRPMPPARAPEAQGYGSLAIRVQPSDAQILIDDEPWEASADGERLVVQVSAGTHRVEVRKDGFEGFSRTVTVRPGETASMNVSLSRRDE